MRSVCGPGRQLARGEHDVPRVALGRRQVDGGHHVAVDGHTGAALAVPERRDPGDAAAVEGQARGGADDARGAQAAAGGSAAVMGRPAGRPADDRVVRFAQPKTADQHARGTDVAGVVGGSHPEMRSAPRYQGHVRRKQGRTAIGQPRPRPARADAALQLEVSHHAGAASLADHVKRASALASNVPPLRRAIPGHGAATTGGVPSTWMMTWVDALGVPPGPVAVTVTG